MFLGGHGDYRYIDDLGIEDSWITLAFTDDVPNHPDRSGP